MNTKQHQTECTGSETRDATPGVAAAGQVEVAPLRQASSVPVDVLAVMERDAADAELWRHENCGVGKRVVMRDDSDKARAAVAELIAALRKEDEWRARDEAGALDLSWDYETMVGQYRRAALARVATGDCTCPSGDGSLRWPCPAHPAALAVCGGVK